MGYTYVHINSSDRKPHETSSKMTIHLSNPIHKAHTVKVMSFSCANEFYNIIDGNNEIIILIYEIAGGVIAVNPTIVALAIPPGLYTTDELMNEFEAALADYDEDTRNVNVAFEVLASNKIQLQFVSAQNQPRRVVLFYEQYNPNFYTSVVHRMGFSREQVAGNWVNFRNTDVNGTYEAVTPDGQWVSEEAAPYLVWKTNVITGQIRVSNNVGFESYPFVYLKSDELVKHATRTIQNADGSVATAHTNVLQKIPIDTNIFNWIHYFGSDAIFEHTLDGRTIQDFDIGLTNHVHGYFPASHFKDFNVELLFETVDDEDENKRAIVALAKKGYEIRHNCSLK